MQRSNQMAHDPPIGPPQQHLVIQITSANVGKSSAVTSHSRTEVSRATPEQGLVGGVGGDAAEFVAGVAISQRASQFGDRSQAGEAAVFSAARPPPRAQKLGLLAIGSSSAR